MEGNHVARVIKMICRYGAVDIEMLKYEVGLDVSTAERVLGVLISSGYVVEAELEVNPCRLCPFSTQCSYTKNRDKIRAYFPSEKLKRLCRDVS